MKNRIIDILMGTLMVIVGMIMIIGSLKTRDTMIIKLSFAMIFIGAVIAVIDDRKEVSNDE